MLTVINHPNVTAHVGIVLRWQFRLVMLKVDSGVLDFENPYQIQVSKFLFWLIWEYSLC